MNSTSEDHPTSTSMWFHCFFCGVPCTPHTFQIPNTAKNIFKRSDAEEQRLRLHFFFLAFLALSHQAGHKVSENSTCKLLWHHSTPAERRPPESKEFESGRALERRHRLSANAINRTFCGTCELTRERVIDLQTPVLMKPSGVALQYSPPAGIARGS